MVCTLPRLDFEAKPVVKFSCTAVAFAQAVHDAATNVLVANGLKGYKELWAEHAFPTSSGC